MLRIDSYSAATALLTYMKTTRPVTNRDEELRNSPCVQIICIKYEIINYYNLAKQCDV